MADIFRLIADRLDEMESTGRRPIRLVLGHQEAAEVESAAYRPAKTWRGLFGEVIAEEPEHVLKLPYPLVQRCEIFCVEVERVDRPTFLGVIGE